ncbi:MAG: CRISPR system precrRNA processing endoribonuclease RAMP protein Cas6 [Candidatus Promineifilaceae bacterium]
MKQISLTIDPTTNMIHRDYVTGFGLHGLFFHALRLADPYEAERLHGENAPKPFVIRPKYKQNRLTTIQFNALETKTSQLLENVWQAIYETEYLLRLGRHPLQFDSFTSTQFNPTTNLMPNGIAKLRFVTPTVFRQGTGYLPLPIPANIFQRPFHVWQKYGTTHPLPADWLAWCERNVFVKRHQIKTVQMPLNRHLSSYGFVGDVTLGVASKEQANQTYVCGFSMLVQLAAYCGVGYRTTMGMGAVELA